MLLSRCDNGSIPDAKVTEERIQGPLRRTNRTDQYVERVRLLLARLMVIARRHPYASLLGLEAWLAYAAYQLWIVVTGPIGYWNDSAAYVSVARSPFPSVALLSGQRPPLVPLLWKMTGSPLSFAVTQTVFGIVAWTILAITVARLVRPGWPGLLAGASVLAFASCWQVTEWNWNVLSESVALSATAIVCAATIWLARRFTLSRACVLALACCVLVADRDQTIWVVGPAGVAIGLYGVVMYLGTRRRSVPTRELLLLALSLFAIASLAELGAASSHRNVINMKDVFYVRVFPFPARVQWFAQHGMPDSKRVDIIARQTLPLPGSAKVVEPNFGLPGLRRLDRWFEDRAELTYAEFLVTHPGYVLTAPFARPALTYNNDNGNLAFYGSLIGQNPANPANHALPFLPILMFPSWEVTLAVGLTGAALLLERRPLSFRCWVPAFALVATGLWSMLVAWHGDGMEVARHTIEGNIEVRIAVLVLAIQGVLGSRLSTGPSTRSAHEPDSSIPPPHSGSDLHHVQPTPKPSTHALG